MPTTIKKKVVQKPIENSYEQALKGFYKKDEDSSKLKEKKEVLDEFWMNIVFIFLLGRVAFPT